MIILIMTGRLSNYFFVVSAGAGVAAGVVVFVGKPLVIANENTTIKANKTQVPFSNTSPVRCTPNMLLLAPPVAKPPPLGFWIKMNRAKAIHAITNKTISRVVAILYNNFKFSFLKIV
jgi:hypothetical protein